MTTPMSLLNATSRPLAPLAATLLLLLPVACGDSGGASTSDASSSGGESEGTSGEGSTEATTSAGTGGSDSEGDTTTAGATEGTTDPGATETDTGTSEPDPSQFCVDHGLPIADFDAGAGGLAWLWCFVPTIIHFTALIAKGHIGDVVKARPSTALFGKLDHLGVLPVGVIASGFVAYAAFGLATALGKNLER